MVISRREGGGEGIGVNSAPYSDSFFAAPVHGGANFLRPTNAAQGPSFVARIIKIGPPSGPKTGTK